MCVCVCALSQAIHQDENSLRKASDHTQQTGESLRWTWSPRTRVRAMNLMEKQTREQWEEEEERRRGGEEERRGRGEDGEEDRGERRGR